MKGLLGEAKSGKYVGLDDQMKILIENAAEQGSPLNLYLDSENFVRVWGSVWRYAKDYQVEIVPWLV